ncbi:MAG TPA: N-6 DNA methylase [Bryobacteraceae bacterium]|nr:N-6 DNA methylase [Bryobacteraceae bacterium]
MVQVIPTAGRFRQDFGRESPAYGDAMQALRLAWRRSREDHEPSLAYQMWQRYLTVTYGSLPVEMSSQGRDLTGLEELFLKHTYLASVARLMVSVSIARAKPANPAEFDCFQWIRPEAARDPLRPAWERMIAQIETYDFSRLDQDVLKGVYQELVDPADRHDLGEYYTPDWLSERMVSELLPEAGYVKVLDPACGSGSFLRAAIIHFLGHDKSPDAGRFERVLEHVVGIDVHPLAVVIARATYVLALRPVIQEAKRPFSVPVHLADSLAGTPALPALRRRRFDVIVGNPPWISYRYIADPDFQAEIKRLAVEEYRIAPNKQKLMTQMELATVFAAHSMGWFAAPGARLGFVMPRSILCGDQHENLRLRKYSGLCRLRLSGYWDMKNVAPLFNVPTCVLFAEESADAGSAADVLPVKEWSGKLEERDCPWADAAKKLTCREAEGRVIYLAQRSAFSTSTGAARPGISSPYADNFGQGATIVPRCFYFVRGELTFPIDPDGLYWTDTDPDQLKLAKKPWHDVHLSGRVEGRFFHYVVLAGHILPFALLTPSLAVIPLTEDGSKRHVLNAAALKREGFRDFGNWMEEAERIWTQKREQKAGRVSLEEWLDYQGKLTAQQPGDEYVVLYNTSGANVSAVSVRKREFALPLVFDSTVYAGAVTSAGEADYLASVLNSTVSNEAIKPFQAMGLLGERHIHKKLLDLPIPLFQPEDSRHAALARLGREARETAVGSLVADLPAPLAKRRGMMRDGLKAEIAEIDGIVMNLL